MTHINDLRDRVTLLKRHIVEEKNGTFTETWQEGGFRWAKVIPCENREILGEGWNVLNPGRVKYKVTLRYHRGRFERLKWKALTLALLCPPLKDARCQWMHCFMYVVGEEND